MAQKRMFDKTIVDSDDFLEMPLSTQALYFHLNMRADDDGFINNWKAIMRIIGAKEDDLKVLISKNYIIPFETGVIVIRHWKINNYLQKDRKKATKYIEEIQQLKEVNGEYFLLENDEISNILLLDEKREIPEWQKKRDEAYKNSSLPYCFLYKIRNAFNNCECPICGNLMKTSGHKKYIPTIQHLKPISKGGCHELENIAIICLSCNTSLRDKIINEKLNNNEVIKKWKEIQITDKYLSRLTSVNIDKYSIEESRIEENRVEESSIYSPAKQDNIPYKEIIDYLNIRINTHYKYSTKKTRDLIKTRFNEGFNIDDFMNVIDKKANEWLNDKKMEKYLRPATLFGTNFESYLNQPNKKRTLKDISLKELEVEENDTNRVYTTNENISNELW